MTGGEKKWQRETRDTHTCRYNFIWMHTSDHTLMYMYIYYNELMFQ